MKALLIAEKPSLMRDIRTVYDKIEFQDDITFKAFRGHLLELKEPNEYDKKWEEWSLNTLPIIPTIFKYKVKKDCSSLYQDIKKEIENGGYDYVINACDAGREGELIFYSFYKTMGCRLPIKRFWASDTTEGTIEKALRNLIEDTDPVLVRLKASAQYRAYFDWLTGMNFSRAISLKTKATISAGRVKTPTLKMIVDRELEIKNFKPKDFWELQANFNSFSATWFDKELSETKIFDRDKAETLSRTLSKKGTVESVEKKREKNYAPTLHSLLELQKEANQVYGYTADKTLKIAQILYESKRLLTYPRTESRYLPKAMVKEILPHIESLKDIPEVSKYVQEILNNKTTRLDVLNSKKYVDDSKVTDHHAILPTKAKANLANLNEEEYNIYILVVKRFLSIFLDPNIVDKTMVLINIDDNNFKTSGKCLVQKGFTELYSTINQNDKDIILPEIKKGDILDVTKFNLLTKKTAPPKRYDDSLLLQAMQNAGRLIDDSTLRNVLKESAGLGTSATRAEIISELVRKKMIERKGKLIYATEFGIKIIQTLGDRDIALPELTAKWEMRLREIEDGQYNPKAFYEEMIKYVEEMTQDIIDNVNTTINSKETIIVSICPKCGDNVVEGKTFYLCSNYKKSCDFIIPKEFNGAKITKSNLKKIVDGGVTEDKQFTFKSGKSGTGKLKLNSEGALEIVFPEKKPHDTIGRCPKCGQDIIDGNKFYFCKSYKNGCDFVVSKEYNGANITKTDLLNLLNKEETEEKICTWKSGKSGKAKLKFDENYRVMPVFNTKASAGNTIEYKSIGKCPHCDGQVLNAKDFYVCSNYPNSCKFNLKKVINKANITEKDAINLINGKETQSIAFVWKSGNVGNAKLKYTNKLEFIF